MSIIELTCAKCERKTLTPSPARLSCPGCGNLMVADDGGMSGIRADP